jgi:hypothetical protein
MNTLAKSIKEEKLPAPQIGKAGELRVRAELILQGLSPAVCDNDDGIDIIIANNGKKLQVKSSFKPHRDEKAYSLRYSFAIRQPQIRNAGNGLYIKKHMRKNYDQIDYFVFCLLEHNIFYIIPEKEIGEKVSFCIPTPIEDRKYRIYERKQVSKYEKYRNAWDLLK